MTKPLIFIFYLLISNNAFGQVIKSDSPDLLPETLDNYADIQLPAHFLTTELQRKDNTPSDNPTSDAGATLGRVLFYDKKLSADNTISCGSCHIQMHGFSNVTEFGVGINGQSTFTKTPPLDNLRWRFAFGTSPPSFDGDSSFRLEDQALLAITDSREMGQTSLFDAISAIEQQPYYPQMFINTFGDSAVTQDRIAKALSQFMRSMLSFNSKFDRGIVLEFSNFTPQENLGRLLFNSDRTNCNLCHESALLHQNSGSGNGSNPVTSMARGSLRNINNRKFFTLFSQHTTLRDMLDHYNLNVSRCVNGIQVPTDSGEMFPFGFFGCDLGLELLDANRDGIKMELSNEEVDAIIRYLKTLSDPIDEYTEDENGDFIFNEHSLLLDKKFSDPFFKVTPTDTESGKIIPSIMLLLE